MIGLRELAIVVVVVVALYGRANVLRSQRVQSILPWISPTRRTSPGSRRAGRNGPGPAATRGGLNDEAEAELPEGAGPWARRAAFLRGNGLYWALIILAATAIAAWIVTRTLIVTGAGPSPASHP